MSESKNPHGIRGPGPEHPKPIPIPPGSLSSSAIFRNNLQAADPEADVDEILPEAVAELVATASGLLATDNERGHLLQRTISRRYADLVGRWVSARDEGQSAT